MWKVRVKTISARRALVMLTALIVCTGFWIICAGFWRHITAPPERVAAPHSGGVRPLTPLPPWERAFVQIPSPNWDLRPPGTRVSALVLHATASASGQVAINTFQDPASQRSAHFLLDRNGVIIEMVSPEHRAWHAGRSMLAGVPDANNFSVGVEMVDRNDGQPYTDAQYAALVSLIRRLRTHYNIPDARIVSHRSVALPAGRKSDPVGFDFARLYAALRH